MIHHEVDQRSDAWRDLRRKIPTASRAGDVLTPAGELRLARDKKGLAEIPKNYLGELLAQRIMGHEIERYVTRAMADGIEREPLARDILQDRLGVEILPVGFFTTDDERLGASPDGLIVAGNAREGVEIKCPKPETQGYYLAYGLGDDYYQQCQVQMMIAELDRVVFWSWHPELPPLFLVTERDEAFIKRAWPALAAFCAELDAKEREVRDRCQLAA